MKVRATVFVLFIILFGCRKDKNPNVILSGTLTDCPASSICTYDYYDNADFTNNSQPLGGNYRVFWYYSVNAAVCGPTSRFYFKTSLGSNSFDITSKQIAAGQIVAYYVSCPCCYNISLATKPIGGEVKGKRTDATHWLVNASIIIGTSFNNKPVDTLTVNQYFTLEKIP